VYEVPFVKEGTVIGEEAASPRRSPGVDIAT
jgi:hypothetical protein